MGLTAKEEHFRNAVLTKDIEQLKQLINDTELNINSRYQHGYTVLHLAAVLGLDTVIPLLLEARKQPPWKKDDALDIYSKDEKGYTPLMRAAVSNREQVVRVLMQYGAIFDRTTSNGQDLWEVIEQNSPVIISVIREEEIKQSQVAFAHRLSESTTKVPSVTQPQPSKENTLHEPVDNKKFTPVGFLDGFFSGYTYVVKNIATSVFGKKEIDNKNAVEERKPLLPKPKQE